MARRSIGQDKQGHEVQVAEAVVSSLSRAQVKRLYGEASDPVRSHQRARANAAKNARRGSITPELLAERAAGLQIVERASAPVNRVLPVADVAVKVFGWAWLGSGLLAIGLAFLLGGVPANDHDTWSFPGVSGLLFGLCVVMFPLAGLALLGRNMLYRRRDRLVRSALISWALERPGQLARGLPGLVMLRGRRARIDLSDEPAVNPLLIVGVWVLGGIGAFGVIGLVALLFELLLPSGGRGYLLGMAIWVGISAALVGLAWLLHRYGRVAAVRDARRTQGLVWLYEGCFTQLEDAHRADLLAAQE